jgi:hypothetical protein
MANVHFLSVLQDIQMPIQSWIPVKRKKTKRAVKIVYLGTFSKRNRRNLPKMRISRASRKQQRKRAALRRRRQQRQQQRRRTQVKVKIYFVKTGQMPQHQDMESLLRSLVVIKAVLLKTKKEPSILHRTSTYPRKR